jgi:hypothetical protein
MISSQKLWPLDHDSSLFSIVPWNRVSTAYSFVIVTSIIIIIIIIWTDRWMGRDRQAGRQADRSTGRQTNRKGSRNSQQCNCSHHFLCHDSYRICINQLWPEFQNILLDVSQANDPTSSQSKLSRNLEMFCCPTCKDTLVDNEKSQNPSLYK